MNSTSAVAHRLTAPERLAAAPARDHRLPWAALLIMALTGFVLIATETMPAGLLPQIATGLNVAEGAAGQLVSAYALGTVIATIPAVALTRGRAASRSSWSASPVFLAANTITALSLTSPCPSAPGFSAAGSPDWGDLVADTVDDLAAKLVGHDAVVFSAGANGAGAEQTTLIDGHGLEKAADAAARAGVSRFVLVSAFPESGRGQGLCEGFEHYLRVKKTAELYLTRTGLDWLIVRPGLLREGPGDGRVTAGPAVEYGDVQRDNVAAFIDAALHTVGLVRVIVELTDGPTPVAEAVAQLVQATSPRTV